MNNQQFKYYKSIIKRIIMRENSPSQSYSIAKKAIKEENWQIVKSCLTLLQANELYKISQKILDISIKKDVEIKRFLKNLSAFLRLTQSQKDQLTSIQKTDFSNFLQGILKRVQQLFLKSGEQKYHHVVQFSCSKLNTYEKIFKAFAKNQLNYIDFDTAFQQLMSKQIKECYIKIKNKLFQSEKFQKEKAKRLKIFIQIMKNPQISLEMEYNKEFYEEFRKNFIETLDANSRYSRNYLAFEKTNQSIKDKTQPKVFYNQQAIKQSLKFEQKKYQLMDQNSIIFKLINQLLKSQLLKASHDDIRLFKDLKQGLQMVNKLVTKSNEQLSQLKKQQSNLQRTQTTTDSEYRDGDFSKDKIVKFHNYLQNLINKQQNQRINIQKWRMFVEEIVSTRQSKIIQLNKKITQLRNKVEIEKQQIKNQKKNYNLKQQNFNPIIKPYQISLKLSSLLQGVKTKFTLTEKHFIIKQITQIQNNTISSTSLLYTFDRRNKTNPHIFIDEKPNILIVVRLNSGRLLASYIQPPISKNANFNQSLKGLLMNVTIGKVFHVKKQQPIKLYQYQKDIIFGCSDLRINVEKFHVQSHFGRIKSTFDDQRKGIQEFIEDDQNEAEFESCQIFQIKLGPQPSINTLILQQIQKDPQKQQKRYNQSFEQNQQKVPTNLNKFKSQNTNLKLRPKIIKKQINNKKNLKIYKLPDTQFPVYIPQKKVQKFVPYQSKILDFIEEQIDQKQDLIKKTEPNINQNYQSLECKFQKIDELSYYKYLRFFSSSDLFEEKDSEQKKYIIDLLESLYKPIKFCRLVYKYDRLNRVNVHDYIDKKPNLLLIVKTKGGQILGGYTQDSFQQQKVGLYGFIYSATKKTDFQVNLKSKRLATTYDPYYIMFGNSEIRIKTQDKVIFSNFGILNNYFETKGKDVSFFLEEGGNRQALIETYELYQIFYEDNSIGERVVNLSVR